MPKAAHPTFPLRPFKGIIEWPIEQQTDDWGLTAAQQEGYVEEFRQVLEENGAWHEGHDYYTLRRFLRARGYDIEKAKRMWLDHIHWRRENAVDSLLTDFVFTEREPFLKVYPQGYHKTDKLGRPVYIQLLGQINVTEMKKVTNEERMFNFHIQEYERCIKVILPICSKIHSRNIDTTFGIMDVKGIGLSALTGEIKGMLTKFTKMDQDNYPEMAGHICIINAPAVFRMVWGFVKGLIDPRTQQKIEILGSDYLGALMQWIAIEDIPTFLGGKSHASLIDDSGPWHDSELLTKHGIDAEALKRGCRIHEAILSSVAAAETATTNDTAAVAVEQSPKVAAVAEPEAVVSVSSRNIGGSVNINIVNKAPAAAAGLSGHGNGHANANNRGKTLIERITAIEKQLPDDLERVRARLQQSGEMNGASSTRSAPGGSLLGRVEVLEEALEMLLLAQEAQLEKQRQREAIANAPPQQQPLAVAPRCTAEGSKVTPSPTSTTTTMTTPKARSLPHKDSCCVVM